VNRKIGYSKVPYSQLSVEFSSYRRIFHVVSFEQGQALAEEMGAKFLETSAKSNINTESIFLDLTR
jgi:hypothetical protein